MRHTSYDELVWTCQDSQHLPFMMDLNEYLKSRKARPILIEAPVLVERDPSKDPDISVATDHSCVFFAIDFPWRTVPLAKYFDNKADSPFNSEWQLTGILVSKLLGPNRFELVPILKGWSENRPVIWPDVPLEVVRKDGDLEVKLSSLCPIRELYINMRSRLDEPGQKILDTMVASSKELYYVVREFCEFLEGKKLLMVEPKPPKLNKRSKTRIKVVKRGHMGYMKVWEQQLKHPTTTTPTS